MILDEPQARVYGCKFSERTVKSEEMFVSLCLFNLH